MVKAVINGKKIECGVCGHLLAIKHGEYNNGTVSREQFIGGKENSEFVPYTSLEIKCKHKSKGKFCDAINEINL